MGRNPFFRQYPEYVYKKLDRRSSLIASVNGRKRSFKNILESPIIKDDEMVIVNEILGKLDELSAKIKTNNGKDKIQKYLFRFKGTGPTFESF